MCVTETDGFLWVQGWSGLYKCPDTQSCIIGKQTNKQLKKNTERYCSYIFLGGKDRDIDLFYLVLWLISATTDNCTKKPTSM